MSVFDVSALLGLSGLSESEHEWDSVSVSYELELRDITYSWLVLSFLQRFLKSKPFFEVIGYNLATYVQRFMRTVQCYSNRKYPPRISGLCMSGLFSSKIIRK